MNRRSATLALMLALGGAATEAAEPAFPQTVTPRNLFRTGNDSLTFDRPMQATPHPEHDSVFFVVEQGGRILTVTHDGARWVASDTARIPVRRIGNGSNRNFVAGQVYDGVHTGYYESRGLLGFALHPGFARNGTYYVSYVTVRDSALAAGGTVPREWSIIAERTADTTLPLPRPRSADPERLLLAVNQHPYWDHKGGTIRVGPDGMLYAAFGDGGGISPNDNYNRAQTPGVHHGKLLRIDPSGPDAFPADSNRNFAIPPGNPFTDSADYLPEIWALGLRNPWKWDFHPVDDSLWLGDVGAGAMEKLVVVPRGGNMGWKAWEGTTCRTAPMCDAVPLLPPVLELPTNRTLAGSITGGAFFLGNPASAFHGAYIFGDYVTSRVWALRRTAAGVDTAQIASVPSVTSLDADRRGRILATSIGTGAVTSRTGRVLMLESPDMAPAGDPTLLAHRRLRARTALPATRAELLRDRGRYDLATPDGRALIGNLPRAGTVVVRDRRTGAVRPLILLD